MGEIIKSIRLYGSEGMDLQINEEYLIYAQFLSYDKGALYGRIIKSKLLSDCYDRS